MNAELISKLGDDLRQAGYSLAALETLWGRTAEGARRRGVFAPARRVLAQQEPSALATLGELFLLGSAVSADRLSAALPTLGLAGAAELGLVAAVDTDFAAGSFRAALSLNPVALEPVEGAREWWILSDLDDELRRGPARPDHVMGVGGATRTLLAQVPPAPGATALDLGTGCGIAALRLVELGVPRVVATDISERALTLARANAGLNGLADRIDFRLGDLFEPVSEERFSLIVTNPPFVITPRSGDGGVTYEYRDGGMTGDELAAKVIREAPRRLDAGGSLVCLANWETEWGGHGLERVRGWVRDGAELAGAALDAWVIERDRVDTVQYAETWARDGGARPGNVAFDALLESWLDDFGARHIVSIGLGAIHLRRRAEEPVDGLSVADSSIIHVDQATGPLTAERLGESLHLAFLAGVEAQRASAADVLDTRWVRAAEVVEERIHTPGEESPSAITLVTDRPIARRVAADTLLAAAIGACDGDLTLRQISDALATLLEVDAAAAGEALVAGARELAWLGMIAPEGHDLA